MAMLNNQMVYILYTHIRINLGLLEKADNSLAMVTTFKSLHVRSAHQLPRPHSIFILDGISWRASQDSTCKKDLTWNKEKLKI